MSKRFDAAVADLPRLHTQLVESPLRPVAHSVSDLNFAGIYVLYESGKPVYVGISKNLTKRLRNHLERSSNKAAFAFPRAKDALKIAKASYTARGSRKDLMRDLDFLDAFDRARGEIRNMSVRALREDDSFKLFLLEAYVTSEFGLSLGGFEPH
jgi:hypothetical protein